eukprot:3999818-Prymnesium_polylepis.1
MAQQNKATPERQPIHNLLVRQRQSNRAKTHREVAGAWTGPWLVDDSCFAWAQVKWQPYKNFTK